MAVSIQAFFLLLNMQYVGKFSNAGSFLRAQTQSARITLLSALGACLAFSLIQKLKIR